MTVINLTQHNVTLEQVASGVFDLQGDFHQELVRLLTFDTLPNAEEIKRRASAVADMAASTTAESAMIGGALWLMAPLAAALRQRGIKPVFAFSVRETQETPMPDGSVKKVAVFRHVGFVDAV